MRGTIHTDEVDDGDLGRAAGTVEVGLLRVSVAPGGRLLAEPWDEEFVYVLAGDAESEAGDVAAGDALLRQGAPDLVAGAGGLEALVFSTPAARRRDAPPARAMSVSDAEPEPNDHGPHRFVNRDLGWRLGSRAAGLQHQALAPGAEGFPPHCHSAEEELFVVLEGSGVVVLGDEEVPVEAGSVVSRPAGTAVPHSFRAAAGEELVILAYGTRRTHDIAFYTRTGIANLRGIRRLVQTEPRPDDYWSFTTS